MCSVKLEFESFTTTGVEAGANSKAEKNGGECSMDKLSIDVRKIQFDCKERHKKNFWSKLQYPEFIYNHVNYCGPFSSPWNAYYHPDMKDRFKLKQIFKNGYIKVIEEWRKSRMKKAL